MILYRSKEQFHIANNAFWQIQFCDVIEVIKIRGRSPLFRNIISFWEEMHVKLSVQVKFLLMPKNIQLLMHAALYPSSF